MATARFYRGAQRYLSGFETFSRLLFYVACMAGIVFGILNFHWLVAGIALLIWLLRYITQAIVINRTAKEMGEAENIISHCPYSIFSNRYNLLISSYAAFSEGKVIL